MEETSSQWKHHRNTMEVAYKHVKATTEPPLSHHGSSTPWKDGRLMKAPRRKSNRSPMEVPMEKPRKHHGSPHGSRLFHGSPMDFSRKPISCRHCALVEVSTKAWNSHGSASMVIPWRLSCSHGDFHGDLMGTSMPPWVLPWCFHENIHAPIGTSMVLPWRPLVPPWCSHGASVMLPWRFHRASMGTSCSHANFRCASMILQWDYHGTTVLLWMNPWCFHGALQVWCFHRSPVLSRAFPWWFNGASMVLPRWFYGASVEVP